MSRRDYLTEEQLAWDDERRDAIDRIDARCKGEGITSAKDVVHAIVRDLQTEIRQLVAVELEIPQ